MIKAVAICKEYLEDIFLKKKVFSTCCNIYKIWVYIEYLKVTKKLSHQVILCFDSSCVSIVTSTNLGHNKKS